MTQRISYHFRAPNNLRFSVDLNLDHYPEGERLPELPAVSLLELLRALVNNTELQHVSHPVEVRE